MSFWARRTPLSSFIQSSANRFLRSRRLLPFTRSHELTERKNCRIAHCDLHFELRTSSQKKQQVSRHIRIRAAIAVIYPMLLVESRNRNCDSNELSHDCRATSQSFSMCRKRKPIANESL